MKWDKTIIAMQKQLDEEILELKGMVTRYLEDITRETFLCLRSLLFLRFFSGERKTKKDIAINEWVSKGQSSSGHAYRFKHDPANSGKGIGRRQRSPTPDVRQKSIDTDGKRSHTTTLFQIQTSDV